MTGSQLALLQSYTRYNVWAFRQLFAATAQLQDTQFTAHAGLAFRSVQGTLCHLLVSENVWLSRLKGDANTSKGLGKYWQQEEMYAKEGDEHSYWEDIEPDRKKLQDRILAQAQELVDLVSELTDGAQPVVYRSSSGEDRSLPLDKILLHVVNHSTHHRGQISAAITGFGVRPPIMDYVYFKDE
eukprot:jgi/Hompol1/1876/HPOL_004977-RA